jgi:CheY-like chemotaxis protein
MNNLNKILIADDDLQMQRAMKSVLERSGYQVEISENGKNALERALSSSFNLIISDQKMPEMSG